ncbi:hypothetical protein NPIL_107221 [Nephila pilipes]|uniref:Uncharacterized protein n=1 Tax=Nephila pilipes TaxID=299642 RepID=A0A8X6NVT0_NEPPI|nr:hypothetical protein NPIL_107221 [Nephila pilipes]
MLVTAPEIERLWREGSPRVMNKKGRTLDIFLLDARKEVSLRQEGCRGVLGYSIPAQDSAENVNNMSSPVGSVVREYDSRYSRFGS